MPPAETRWNLQRFEHEFDLWVEREMPGDDARIFVLEWIQTRMDSPYLEVFRSPEIETLWYGPIIDTATPDGRVVVGSYFIVESERVLRCNSFATLSRPII